MATLKARKEVRRVLPRLLENEGLDIALEVGFVRMVLGQTCKPKGSGEWKPDLVWYRKTLHAVREVKLERGECAKENGLANSCMRRCTTEEEQWLSP